MRKWIKYILRFLGWLFFGIIILLVGASLLMQTKAVKRKLSGIAEKQVVKVLEGEIKVGEIKGNFFTGLELDNVLWTHQNDTVAFVNSVKLTYNLFTVLKTNSVAGTGQLIEPYFYLRQETDSIWNVQHLIKESEKDTLADTNSSGNFSFKLSDFELIEGRVKIHAIDPLIPKKIKNINSKLTVEFESEKQSLNLDYFSFQSQQPSFQLDKLSFYLEKKQDRIEVQNLVLKTAHNKMEGEAAYSTAPILDFLAKLESSPVHLNEFEIFIPKLTLPVHPMLLVNAKTVENGLQATLSVSDSNQTIKLNVSSDNFIPFISDPKNTALKYTIDGNIEQVDLAHWLGKKELGYLINGTFNLNGTGTDPKNATIFLDADFKDCILNEKQVNNLSLALNLENGNLAGELNGSGDFGTIKISPDIKNVQGEHPTYQLSVLTKKLNLAPLFGNDSLKSNINMQAQIHGKGFNPEVLTANAEITLSESEFNGIILDTLFGNFAYNKNNLEIDSLWLKTQSAILEAHGNYNMKGASDISLSVRFDGVDEFAAYINIDSLYALGEIEANLSGTTDSMDLKALIELENVQLESLKVENLVVDGSGKFARGDTTFNAHVFAENFRAGSFQLDSVRTVVGYFTDSLTVDGYASANDFNSNLAAQISLADVKKITLSEWKVNYLNQHLELVQSPAIFEIDSTSYKVSNFKMASNATDSAQFIQAEGVLSRSGPENFSLEVANVDIEKMVESTGNEIQTSGIFNLNLKILGTATKPEIEGGFSVGDALYNGYSFTDLGGSIKLENEILNLQGKIVPKDSGRIELHATFPLEARLDSFTFNFNKNKSLDANLVIDNFPLAVLQTINVQEQIKGVLNGNVDVGGTLEKPAPKGNLRLMDASVKMPEYGINYRDIVFNIKFLNDAVRLDSFYIKTSDGDLQASGTVDFNSSFYKGDVSQSEIEVRFNKFNPFNHRQFNMQLSGDAHLKGKKGEVVFEGDLNIPQSEIYLPAILNMTGKISTPEIPEPVLVREMEKLSKQKDTIEVNYLDTINPNGFNFNYLDKFTGKLNVKIPKNTWIKNKDMRIEISGDLEFINNLEYFEIFGSVDVVRGQYDLLGKTFVIDEGTITFQGGEDVVPVINISAAYTFRNSERATQELGVTILGTANEPEIEFELDGEKINEGDALSYMLFGKSLDELTLDQQENVSGSENLAGKAVSALLSSQLNIFLGEQLDVDYIELKSEGDFDNATLVVGKYITNDLFVSYEQRFGETDEKEMAKYEVKLEYELFRFLFFQLNNSSNDSGFDLIFKLNSK